MIPVKPTPQPWLQIFYNSLLWLSSLVEMTEQEQSDAGIYLDNQDFSNSFSQDTHNEKYE
jgi:hypothetical protein